MIGNALAFSVMEIIGNNDGYDGLAILPDMLKEVGVSLTLVTMGIPPSLLVESV